MHHSDTAYRRRPVPSNPAGSVPSAVVIVIVMMMARADVDLECRGRDHANSGYRAGDA